MSTKRRRPKLLDESNEQQKISELYVLGRPLDTSNKIRIDIKDVINFGFCPKYYKLKKEDNNPNMRDLYDESIHRVFYNYLNALQNGTLNKVNTYLKTLWGKEWIKTNKYSDIMITSSSLQRDAYLQRLRDGNDSIFKFDEVISQGRQIPLMVNYRYEVEIIPNVILTGIFEYVREFLIDDNFRTIQLIKFIPNYNKYMLQVAMKYNLELIAMSYAFETLFNVKSPLQVLSFDVSHKRILTNIYNHKHYEILKESIKNIIICIQNNIIVQCPDRKCFNCDYRKICLKTY